MITLITGAPGAGKTAYTVSLIKEFVGDRPLFVHGLDGLTLDHAPVDPHRWHEDVPDGAVIVIDEVQHIWRPRGPSVQPPAAVQALEVHRHRGIDFFMTTQRPNLLDLNVRGLVGRHVHLRDTGWLGRWMYEWPECSESLAWKTCPQKQKFKLPTTAFALYKSASIHTKPVRGRSPWVWFLIGLFLVVSILGFMVYRSIAARSAAPVSKPAAGEMAPASTGLRVKGPHGQDQPLTAAVMRASFEPRLTNRPETAPIYDEVRQVLRQRKVIGGFCRNGEGCRCFDQDGFDPGLTERQCFEWIKNPPFDPWRADKGGPWVPDGADGRDGSGPQSVRRVSASPQ